MAMLDEIAVSVSIKSGAKLYESFIELKALTEQQAKTARRIESLLNYIRSQAEVSS
jgi:hypothetical protein